MLSTIRNIFTLFTSYVLQPAVPHTIFVGSFAGLLLRSELLWSTAASLLVLSFFFALVLLLLHYVPGGTGLLTRCLVVVPTADSLLAYVQIAAMTGVFVLLSLAGCAVALEWADLYNIKQNILLLEKLGVGPAAVQEYARNALEHRSKAAVTFHKYICYWVL